MQVMCNGVLFSLLAIAGFAPASINSKNGSVDLLAAATYNGVLPSLSWISGSAPAANNTRTHSSLSKHAATNNADKPAAFLWFMGSVSNNFINNFSSFVAAAYINGYVVGS